MLAPFLTTTGSNRRQSETPGLNGTKAVNRYLSMNWSSERLNGRPTGRIVWWSYLRIFFRFTEHVALGWKSSPWPSSSLASYWPSPQQPTHDSGTRSNRRTLYRQLRIGLGNTLLLGLEVLVAADIVRTIALEPTAENALILGCSC